MAYDYRSIASVSEAEFAQHRIAEEVLKTEYICADAKDMRRIERLLDLDEDSLDARGPYYLSVQDCANCNSPLRVSDFVLTAMLDAGHPKTFIAQVLLGDKKIVQQARRVRCFGCGTVSAGKAQYWMNDYACEDQKAPVVQ